jgi:hypothetical protein
MKIKVLSYHTFGTPANLRHYKIKMSDVKENVISTAKTSKLGVVYYQTPSHLLPVNYSTNASSTRPVALHSLPCCG